MNKQEKIMEKISVIGAGSWGTALATVLERNGHEVTIWSIMEDEITSLKENHEHLANYKLGRSSYRKRFISICGSFYVYEKYCSCYGTVD